MSKLDRYPVRDLVWRTATESAFSQKLKVLGVLFVVLVSFLETKKEVSSNGLFFLINDKLGHCVAALVNVGIVGDAGIDCGQK